MPTFSLLLEIPDQCSEKEFVEVVVREARRQARQFWRSNNNYVPNVGGRPKIEKAVWDACDIIWREWGEKFPKHNSTMEALVRRVSSRIPGKGRKGKDGSGKTRREDLRTIEKYVRRWIACLTIDQVPDSWLRTPRGKKIVRLNTWMSAVGAFEISNHDPLMQKKLNEALASVTDKQLVDRLLESRSRKA